VWVFVDAFDRSHPGPMKHRGKTNWRAWPSAQRRINIRKTAAMAKAVARKQAEDILCEVLHAGASVLGLLLFGSVLVGPVVM
jgi:hypothetical protein